MNKKQKAQMIFYQIIMLSLYNRLNYGKGVNCLLHLIVTFNYLLHLLFEFSLIKSNPFISVKNIYV